MHPNCPIKEHSESNKRQRDHRQVLTISSDSSSYYFGVRDLCAPDSCPKNLHCQNHAHVEDHGAAHGDDKCLPHLAHS